MRFASFKFVLFFAKGVISPLDIYVARVEGFVKCSLNNTYSSIKVTYFLRIFHSIQSGHVLYLCVQRYKYLCIIYGYI